MYSLLAALVYLATATLCAGAGLRDAQAAGRGEARAIWLGITLFFVALTIARLTNFEAATEGTLRAILERDGDYQSRRDFQAPLASALVIVAFVLGAAAIWLRPRAQRRLGRPLARALTASFAMLVLVAVRIVSFHGTDALLYGGPIHLNWVIDLGLTGVVAWSAWSVVIGRTRPRRR